jgi:hypothetical protein
LRLLFLRELLLRPDDFRPLLRLRPELLLELELLRAPPFLRPPLFAAAMLSLHDEVRTLTSSRSIW